MRACVCVCVCVCGVVFSPSSQILNELLLLHIVTNNPAGIDGPIFTDELVNGQSLTDKYGEGLTVEVAYYKTNVKAVYAFPSNGSGPSACVPKAKWIDINFPICGGSISVHIVSQVMLPLSCTIFPTIEEIALDTPELSLLAEAFSILDGAGVVITGATQFAPTNLAWNRAFLLLGSNKDAVFNNVPLLTDIVLYNRVISNLPICQIKDGSTLLTDPVGAFNPQSNFFQGDEPFLLKVSIRSKLQRLCGGQLANQYIFRRIVISSNTNSAKVLVPDIQACDGRVYITDAVLLPATLFFTLTLMDLVCSASILSTLCSIIRDTPVDSVLALLSSASVKLVLFAPTNFAISSALRYLKIDNADLEVGDLEVLLGFHVAEVDPFNADPVFTFQFRDEVDAFENLEGNDLFIVVTGNFPLEGFFVDGGCNRAQILVPLSNRVAVNGVLHVIDRLLLPPFEQKFCPTPCGRLELNPLTTVFIAAIYALGLDNEYCTVGASFIGDTYDPPRTDYSDAGATIFAPTDLAFAKQLFQGGLTVATIFGSYPERLYDIILYHTIREFAYFSTDLYDGQELFPSVTNTGFFPVATGHITTPTILTARRFDSYSFIRRNLLNTAVFIEGQRCTFSLNPSDCAGRIIVPDQRTLNGGDADFTTIIQVIDQVLTPPFILECRDPHGAASLPAVSLSVAAEVQYVGPVGCSLFCVGYGARCLPCSPFVAQEIFTSPVNGQALSNQPSRIVYTLYVNQIGEVRWGQVPGLVRSKWESDHAIGPVGLIKAGTSIVAQGFLATNLKIFNVIANAIDVKSVSTTSSSKRKDAALLKIYIDGILRGAALADFTSIISLAEIQARITELISTKYIIDRPLFDIRAGNSFGPLVRPSDKGIVGPIESLLLGPYEGGTMSLVDASEMEDGDAAMDSAYTSANDTIAAMQAIGESAVTAQTIYYSLRTGINPVEAIGELFDGIDGVGYYERNGFPDVLATTEFYKNCGPIFNQYKNVDGTGAFGKFSPCGISAVFFQEWAGTIFRLAVYAGTEVFPSQCVGQPFGRPNL